MRVWTYAAICANDPGKPSKASNLRVLTAVLAALLSASPALAQDDDYYDEPEISAADQSVIRIELGKLRLLTNNGTVALESRKWPAAISACSEVLRITDGSAFGGQQAYRDARRIGIICKADGDFHVGNRDLACEAYAKVGYASFTGVDARSECLNQPKAVAAEAVDPMRALRIAAFDDLFQVATEQWFALLELPAEDATRAQRIVQLGESCKTLTSATFLGNVMIGLARLCEGGYHNIRGEREIACRSWRLSKQALLALGTAPPDDTPLAEHVPGALNIIERVIPLDCG